ncbi:MAG: aminodeoxychorismate/anthranilate synthase component II [Methanosphaera sp.]|nr:aminodeoxychorismate/anthranilate synthase component II [Methanosphaera sp.]
MILIIDNYDSFTYNLYQLVSKYRSDIVTYRNDKITLEEIKELNPDHIIISPGPGNPNNKRDFGVCESVIRELKSTPILGVCLGNQGIYASYGGKIVKTLPVHGKRDHITHTDSVLFKDVPESIEIIRYHSLICDNDSLPSDIKVTSRTSNGIIMSIEHKKYPTYGLQFHPESIGGEYGDRILKNFLDIEG